MGQSGKGTFFIYPMVLFIRSREGIMLIYVTIAFLTLSIVLTYRNLRHRSTRFLYAMIFGWTMSMTGLILFVSRHAYYFNILTSLFSINQTIWRRIILLHAPVDMTIRLINIGTWLFVYSLAGFVTSFAGIPKKPSDQRIIFLLLAVFPIIDSLYYDPAIYKAFKTSVFHLDPTTVLNPFEGTIGTMIGILFGSIRLAYYILPVLGLWISGFARPRVTFLRRLFFIHTISITLITIIHRMIFSWAPMHMIKGTLIDGYFFYRTPSFDTMVFSLRIFPFVVYGVLFIIAILIYRYNTTEAYQRNLDTHIRRSIDTAKLGVRTVAHSVKNHLVAIQNEADYLRRSITLNEDQSRSLELILESCNTSLEYFTTVDRKLGSISVDLHPVDLEGFVKIRMEGQKRVPDHINIKINLNNSEAYCYIDEDLLADALTCLLDNAVEAIADEPGTIEINVLNDEKWGIIEVRDTGCGIEEEFLSTIFSPFVSTKASTNNWGIGLSYCHRIMSAHGGKVTVETKTGQGSCFRIALPII
jgi:signal transduction histidine kinase